MTLNILHAKGFHLRIVSAAGLLGTYLTVPEGCGAFLIRDSLACDILPAGKHHAQKGDKALLFPSDTQSIRFEIDVPAHQAVVLDLNLLKATFHGSDCFQHFFAGNTDTEEVNITPLLASFITERKERLTDCMEELRRLVSPYGIDLVNMHLEDRKQDAQTENVGQDEAVSNDANDQPASNQSGAAQPVSQGLSASSDKNQTAEADEDTVLIRLGVEPTLRRSWWRREGLAAFEHRLLGAVGRHLNTVLRSLGEARSGGLIRRDAAQDSWDRCDALLRRVQAQQPQQLITDSGSRQSLIKESRQLCALCEQAITIGIPENDSQLNHINHALEELRRALDRRSDVLTGFSQEVTK